MSMQPASPAAPWRSQLEVMMLRTLILLALLYLDWRATLLGRPPVSNPLPAQCPDILDCYTEGEP